MQSNEVDNTPAASKISKFGTGFLKCTVYQDHKSKPPIKPQKIILQN